MLKIRSLNRVVLQLKQRCAVFFFVSQTKVQQTPLNTISSSFVKRGHFAFFSRSDSGWKPRCSGFPSVAFSEQEEGGTNDRYRNEVATGPLVGEDGGVRASVELYGVGGAERCHCAPL